MSTKDTGTTAGRSVVVSVAAGVATALVLSLVVFAGGSEATITGALLLGSGFGWGLMAFLTVRRTDQPQRWAVVPATVMGGAGAALVITDPGGNALAVMGWAWPPLLLALAVWAYVRARRSVTGKARWLLTPVIAVLALIAVGATYGNIATTRETDYAAPGKLYDVGGHQMRRGYALLPTFRRVGLGGLIPWTSHLPGPDAAKVVALTSTTQAASNQRDEISVIREVFAQAQDLTTLDDRPVAVVTASETAEATDGWVAAQEELAGLSTNLVHRTVDATHAGLLEDAGPATESVGAITEVIASVRTGTSLDDLTRSDARSHE
jgi:hypothetical protein